MSHLSLPFTDTELLFTDEVFEFSQQPGFTTTTVGGRKGESIIDVCLKIGDIRVQDVVIHKKCISEDGNTGVILTHAFVDEETKIKIPEQVFYCFKHVSAWCVIARSGYYDTFIRTAKLRHDGAVLMVYLFHSGIKMLVVYTLHPEEGMQEVATVEYNKLAEIRIRDEHNAVQIHTRTLRPLDTTTLVSDTVDRLTPLLYKNNIGLH